MTGSIKEKKRMDREFFKKYHRAVVKANAKELEKLKSKIGSEWAEEFKTKAGEGLEGEDFRRQLQEYLKEDLRFCNEVKIRGDGNELNIEVRGCDICHGNEELRREGQPTLCPIVPTGLFSISRVAGRRATLQEVRKPGVVGECEICYRLQ
ncbi:MAG: hypothetical protein A2W01_10590 [Candidatus Solincola sediminis]|nr:MAG: hypothetical protein A2W01_10590 [Candidatus Solincola sediminis]